jgi:hypothetical protein
MIRPLVRDGDATARRVPPTVLAVAVVALAIGLAAGTPPPAGAPTNGEPIVLSVRGLTCGAVHGLG